MTITIAQLLTALGPGYAFVDATTDRAIPLAFVDVQNRNHMLRNFSQQATVFLAIALANTDPQDKPILMASPQACFDWVRTLDHPGGDLYCTSVSEPEPGPDQTYFSVSYIDDFHRMTLLPILQASLALQTGPSAYVTP